MGDSKRKVDVVYKLIIGLTGGRNSRSSRPGARGRARPASLMGVIARGFRSAWRLTDAANDKFVTSNFSRIALRG